MAGGCNRSLVLTASCIQTVQVLRSVSQDWRQCWNQRVADPHSISMLNSHVLLALRWTLEGTAVVLVVEKGVRS